MLAAVWTRGVGGERGLWGVPWEQLEIGGISFKIVGETRCSLHRLSLRERLVFFCVSLHNYQWYWNQRRWVKLGLSTVDLSVQRMMDHGDWGKKTFLPEVEIQVHYLNKQRLCKVCPNLGRALVSIQMFDSYSGSHDSDATVSSLLHQSATLPAHESS